VVYLLDIKKYLQLIYKGLDLKLYEKLSVLKD